MAFEPDEVFSLAEYIAEELRARGWRTEDAAARMQTSNGAAVDLFCLDLLMSVQDDAIAIDDDFYSGLGRAFDVNPHFLRNLQQTWVDNPSKRSAFDVPDEIFGPTSRRALIRVVK